MAWSTTQQVLLTSLFRQGRWAEAAQLIDEYTQQTVENAVRIATNTTKLTEVQKDTLSARPTPTYANRTFGTQFTISSDRPALAIYTVELSVALTSLSVQLLNDFNDPPTTVVGEAAISTTLLSGLLSLTSVTRQQIVAWIPANSRSLLVTSGSGTATLVQPLELIF